MNVPDPLSQAAATVPRRATSAAGTTVADAVGHLDHNQHARDGARRPSEAGAFPTPPRRRPGTSGGSRSGDESAPRQGLVLLESRRGGSANVQPRPATCPKNRIPGDGILRPLWHIGLITPEDHPGLHVARTWVEGSPKVTPDAYGAVDSARLDSLQPPATPGWMQPPATPSPTRQRPARPSNAQPDPATPSPTQQRPARPCNAQADAATCNRATRSPCTHRRHPLAPPPSPMTFPALVSMHRLDRH